MSTKPGAIQTQLGKIEHGFDWLGVWFTPAGTSIAPRALENHRAQRLRLYEQARRRGLSATDADARVQAYLTRWNIWVMQMLGEQSSSRLDGLEEPTTGSTGDALYVVTGYRPRGIHRCN